MLKNITGLAFSIADKTYHLVCDPDSPLDSIEKALFQFLNHVRQIKEAAEAQAKQAAAVPQENVPEPVPSPDVKE